MNSPHRKKISIVVPVYNEELSIPTFYQQLKQVLSSIAYDTEVLFVNDASTDGSQAILEGISASDPTVKVIEFVRNFGKEIATTAGINQCIGDVCIMLDADLQHPPEQIPDFIKKWEEGAEVVVGIRRVNKGEDFVKRIGSFWFYKIINAIGYVKLIPYTTDFRLIDREVIDTFNTLSEKNRITRGLIDWMGFRSAYVYFDANVRASGSASYSTIKLFRLAFASIVSLSLFPLRLAGYLGLIITLFSGLLGLVVVVFKYVYPTAWGLSITGSATLAIIIVFLVGIILICLGLIALYIANIHSEVINRPMYIVRKKR
ncbi:MAG: glycosyltransferase family 2 protein [Candidatus Kerfeldbacteria bacterium]